MSREWKDKENSYYSSNSTDEISSDICNSPDFQGGIDEFEYYPDFCKNGTDEEAFNHIIRSIKCHGLDIKHRYGFEDLLFSEEHRNHEKILLTYKRYIKPYIGLAQVIYDFSTKELKDFYYYDYPGVYKLQMISISILHRLCFTVFKEEALECLERLEDDEDKRLRRAASRCLIECFCKYHTMKNL